MQVKKRMFILNNTQPGQQIIVNNPFIRYFAVIANHGTKIFRPGLSGLCILALLGLNISVSVGQTAGPATIKRAEWRIDDNKLVVKGKQAEQGMIVTVSDADSGSVLGTAEANQDGVWRLKKKLTANVPCNVIAQTAAFTDQRSVNNAPADCGPDTTADTVLPQEPDPTPPQTSEPVSPPAPEETPVATVEGDPLIAQGEQLFFNETFGGNGRTCGSCHRAENNFTIDADFIATLPADDPLFVAEYDPALLGLEDPVALRQFGLIRANADGLEDPTQKFVLRSVSHMFGMASSIQSNSTEAPFEMTGWSGDGAPGNGTLREFTNGAITQHFTKSLNRIEGVDFRFATDAELDAILAYTLTLGDTPLLDLNILRLSDAAAEAGRLLFVTEDSENGTKRAAKCNACHLNAGALTVA